MPKDMDRMIIKHVYSDYPRMEGGSRRRHHVARMTWGDSRLVNFPVLDSHLQRSSTDIGDTRRLPFVNDMVDYAAFKSGDPHSSVIVLTNDDTCLCVNFVDILIAALQLTDCCYAHRRDFVDITGPMTVEEITAGWEYPGFDMFAFRVSWWRKVRNTYPDMIMGCEWWDCVMYLMMLDHKGLQLKDVIYHEQHDALWCKPHFINSNPGQVHAKKAAFDWFESRQHPAMVKTDSVWRLR